MRIAVTAAAVCLSIVGLSVADDARASIKQFTNIPAQGLGTALQTLAQQREFQVVYLSDNVDSLRTSGAVGELTSNEALTQLLSGTGLTFRYLDEKTVTVMPLPAGSSSDFSDAEAPNTALPTVAAAAQSAGPAVRLAQSDTTQNSEIQTATQNPENKKNTEVSSETSENKLEVVLVTGTNIRGQDSVGSPIQIYDAEDFARAGAATPQQFMETLTQNFGGGRNEDTHGQTEESVTDETYGSAANLRGLGSGSTLVLINGRRAAAAGDAEYIDISMIPLSAVERIEVLTDGASAIYGADAIGGVVNFIMRRDYTGAETRLLAGTTTQGGGTEYQVAQSIGAGWSSGNALLSYEYHEREPVTALQREFTQNFGSGGDSAVVAGQESHGVYFTVRQDLAPDITLFADANYGTRRASDQIFDGFALAFNRVESESEQYGATLGTDLRISETWRAEITVGSSWNVLDSRTTLFDDPSLGIGTRTSDYEVRSLAARFSGDLIDLPAGRSKLAFGVDYREEYFNQAFGDTIFGVSARRGGNDYSVGSAYAEIYLPLLAGEKGAPTQPLLAMSLAGRHESYSNFGETFNPRIGLEWTPWSGLQIRGSFGTSFKAPTLVQLDETGSAIFSSDVPLPRSLRLGGNNEDLGPETAETWSLGFDYEPSTLEGLRIQFTYFDILYKDRIGAVTVLPFSTQLSDPAYAGTVILRGEIPDAEFDALVAAILANPEQQSFFGCPGPPNRNPCGQPVSNFNAILDRRLLNLASTRDTGVDLSIAQAFEHAGTEFELGLSLTHIVSFERQFTEDAPTVEQVDTLFHPVDLRVRAFGTLSRDALSLTGTVNYTDSFTNTTVSLPEEVGSWTTFDLNARYRIERSVSGPLRGTTFTFNVENVFDEDPPFALTPGNMGYDPTNANPYGRVVSIGLTKSW